MNELELLFQKQTGRRADFVKLLTQAGSNRAYYRLGFENGESLIGVKGTQVEENRAFFSMGSQLLESGINVPEIYAKSEDEYCYLQQDLGSVSLFDLLKEQREGRPLPDTALYMLRETVKALPKIQLAGKGFDYSHCYPVSSFTRQSVNWDLNYFKYCFLKATGVEFNEYKLEEEFDRLSDILLEDSPHTTFMYRDFQARNVMVYDGKPWFIDFQGGRRGPLEYDLVSLLWQAKSRFSPELREELTELYTETLDGCGGHGIDMERFRERIPCFALFRTLQVLGAYGLRGYFERKPHFLQSVPYAMENLKGLMPTVKERLPYLTHILSSLTEKPECSEFYSTEPDILTVSVNSFSYRKGIPSDISGNGGGFVFDCRSMHNPGLIDEYKPLNGTHQAVIDFLESEGEVQPYMESVYALVDAAVEKYIKRGFTSLMVSFGCTGGRHRSVYCAEHLARHLNRKYSDAPLKVVLKHRAGTV